jgi:hypothetical protein
MENINFGKIKLGRLAIGVMICVFMITTSLATTMGNSIKTKNQMNLNVSDSLSYTFLFKEPSFQSLNVDGSKYTKINMPGCLAIGKQAGDPDIPVKFIQLLLPPMMTVDSIEVTGTPVEVNLKGVDLTTTPIFPYQNEVPLNNPLPQTLEINDAIYTSSSVYPSENHGDYHIGYSHGYAVLDFSLNPVQYIPRSGQLYYYPDLTVTINLQETGYQNPFFANNAEDEAWVKSLVSNPEIASLYSGSPTFEYPGGLCDPSHHYDYVIITTTQNGLDYWDTSSSTPYNWESLMNHHVADGLSCTLVTIQDINDCTDYQSSDPLFNDQPAHIREFCKDAYEDWGTRYVLIGGDAPNIAARQLSYEYEGPVDSDLYWSNLDNTFNADHDSSWGEEGDSGFDLYSEIYIGRIVCDEPQDVSNWLTKSFYYADSTDYEYLNNAAFYGGDSTWNCQGDDFVDFGAVKTTTNWLGPNPGAHGAYPTWLGMQYGFETWNLVNPGNEYNLSVKWSGAPSPNPGWNSGDEIGGLRNDINNDQVTLLSAFAHADYTMSCDVYDTDWETLYHNTQPFFVTDMGCHCGDFDAGDGILESMLFHSDINLAFACTYNTGYGWGSFDDTNSSSALQMKCFWDYFFDVENNSQSQSDWQFGKGQAWSKDTMAPTLTWTYSSAPGSWRGVIECCLFFGDPAQTLKTPSPSEPPETPDAPQGPNQWIRNIECTFSSVTTDPEGDNISYIFDWGDGTLSSWLGPYPSGQTVEEEHIWTELGDYEIKVAARDIYGAKSSWSPAATLSIVEDQAPIKPGITGKQRIVGGLNYNYTFVSTDPEGDNIYYKIDWDDGHVTDWLGPYSSGESIALGHKWLEKGDYTIKAWAKDIYEKMSGQSNYMVKVLFVINSNPSNNQMMLNILQSLQQKATNS